MNRLFIALVTSSLLITASYGSEETDALRQEILALQYRIQQLEARLDKQQETPAVTVDRLSTAVPVIGQTSVATDTDRGDFLGGMAQLKELRDRVEVSGNVDILGVYSDSHNEGGNGAQDASDVFVDQVRLNFDIDISDWVQAYIGLQFEDYKRSSYAIAGSTADTEDDGDLQLDEAYVTLGLCDFSSLTVGKQYFPFGNVSEYGHFINDTLARQLYETRDTGVTLTAKGGGATASLFGFNGSAEQSGEDNKLDSWGAALAYDVEQESFSASFGVSYLNNLYQSDNSVGSLLAGPAPTFVEDLGAVDFYGVFRFGPFWLSGEYVQATDEAETGDRTDIADAVGEEPNAWTVEAAAVIPIQDRDYILAGKYEENGDLDLFARNIESIWGIGVTAPIYDNTRLSLNYEFQELAQTASLSGHSHWWGAELSVGF